MKVTSLSKHFCDRWRSRVGGEPSLEQVNGLISQSQRTRRQKRVWLGPPGRMRSYNILAEYWHNDAGLIIRVDEVRRTAVTVIAWGDGGV